MRRHSDTVVFGTTEIPFSIRRSKKRNTIAVTVHPNFEVKVTAPARIRGERIHQAVKAKASWVLRQWDRLQYRDKSFRKQFVSGESFFYLGRQLKLKVVRSKRVTRKSEVRLVKGQLRVTLSGPFDARKQADQVRNLLIRWYRNRAMERLTALVDRIAKTLGVRVTTVHIREMKKRWGSSVSNGAMIFNWRIIMAPRRLIEYVVAHELCHLRHDNHSREFWRLLERIMPSYERRRMELEFYGPKFDLR